MLIPRLRPFFTFREFIASFACWRGGVSEFERIFADKFNTKHAISFSYGRTGLYVLLKALGLHNSEVICPGYTCIVVPHAIVLSGNRPVFVDCGNHCFNMDMEGIETAITSKTRAIIVTHLFGYPMNCEMIQQIVSKWNHKIYIIHDCAHSFGAKWKGQYVWEYGDAAIFGLGIGKIISSLYGGMCLTNSDHLAMLIKEKRHDIIVNCKGRVYYASQLNTSDDCNVLKQNKNIESKKITRSFKLGLKSLGRLIYLLCIIFGFNPSIYPLVKFIARYTSLLDRWIKYFDPNKIEFPKDAYDPMLNIESRIGIVQLQRYEYLLQRRRDICKLYDEYCGRNLADDNNVGDGATISHYPLIVQDREKSIEKLYDYSIEAGMHIEYTVPNIPAYKVYADSREYLNSEQLAKHVINIPIYPMLTDEQVQMTCNALKSLKDEEVI